MYSDGAQFYVAADDEFIRFTQDNTLIERRPLPLPYRFFSRPILGSKCFSRTVRKTAQGNPIVEIRMNNNPNFVLDLDFTQLGDIPNLSTFPEENSRYAGAFNTAGNQLLIPAVNISANNHDFYLIDLLFDATASRITSNTIKTISIPELPAAFGSVSNVSFLNGNYYVISLDGSFRITPDGEYSKLFQTHLWDFFVDGNEFLAIDRGGRLYESVDNGLNWNQRENEENILIQQVEVAGEHVLTHQSLGFPFSLANEDYTEKTELLLNVDFPQDFAAYRQIILFNNRYYLNVQKRLYWTDELLTEVP